MVTPGVAPPGTHALGRSDPQEPPVPRWQPRVVVAAAASGQGKTTVATGLMAALRSRGLAVSPHKVGPDYIDPGYHTVAAGRPGRNLDPWLVGERRIVPLLLHGAATPVPADVAVVEGVMGLYDGAGPSGDLASTAHVARLLRAPVVLVLDARAQSRTAAAVVLGMRAFDPGIRLGGVVLNNVGSDGHERLLRAAVAELGVPVLGALRRDPEVAAPSRHLGLVPAAERTQHSAALVEALGQLVAASVDLDAVLALARSAPPVTATAWDPAAELAGDGRAATGSAGSAVLVAVAGGAAFTFSYRETTELLAAAGARVAVFDPLTDPYLPAGTRGVVIGGGFPELHAEALSANAALRGELAGFEGPVTAECAGLLYLGRSLDGVPMCGRLDLQARMTPRLALGYRRAVAVSDSPVAAREEVVHGHEFHRTTTDPGHGPEAAWSWEGQRHGFVSGAVHASYLHTHWAGHPDAAARFVAACG